MDPLANLCMKTHVKLQFFLFFKEVEQNFEKEGTKEIERTRGVYFQALKSIEK